MGYTGVHWDYKVQMGGYFGHIIEIIDVWLQILKIDCFTAIHQIHIFPIIRIINVRPPFSFGITFL